jgi:hypothetical protein
MADAKPPAKPAPKKPAAPVVAAPKTAEIVVAIIVLIVVLPIALKLLDGFETNSPLIQALDSVFGYVKVLSTVIVMVAVVVAVYAYIRVSDLVAEENKKLGLSLNWNSERKQKNVRWDKVEEYMKSVNPSDWKIAILEADNILDEVVERMGYQGSTLGERMKMIEASDFPYLDEAWQAHKVRNSIAHKGTDYPLTRSEADQTIDIYHRVFRELGYLS